MSSRFKVIKDPLIIRGDEERQQRVAQGALSVSEFSEVVCGFLSGDNETRQHSEREYNTMKLANPTGTVKLILELLAASEDVSIRTQAAVLIRNIFRSLITDQKSEEAGENLWLALSPEFRGSVKSALLKCLEEETAKAVRTSICDSVADMAYRLLDQDEGWPELTPRLFAMVGNAQNPDQQQSGFRVLSEIVEQMQEQMEREAERVAAVVSTSMQSQNLLVRHECVSFVVAVVSCSRKLWRQFQSCVPLIIGTIDLIQQHQQDILSEYLQNLVRISESDSAFWRQHLSLVLERMLRLATQQTDEDIGCLAVEALLSIAENKPRMIRDSPLVRRLVEVLLELMLDIQSAHYTTWLDTGEGRDEEEQRRYDVGESGLDRVAKALSEFDDGGVIPIVFQFVTQFLQAQEWHYRFVGIMAMSQTVEYLPDNNLETNLDQIMKLLLERLKDSDRHVRFAACQALGQVSLDHQPLVQERYALAVLPALAEALDDPHLRVQSHAASAFVNFAEEVDPEVLQPMADMFMNKLYEKLDSKTPLLLLREYSVTAIAVIAGVLDEDFIPYYEHIMPAIKQIISSCVSKEERTLRGKAIECISIIGLSVGEEQFAADGMEGMNALLYLFKSGLEDDDPVKDYLQEALGRMCKALHKTFAQYLPTLVGPMLEVLQTKPVVIEDEDEEDEDMTMVMVSEGKCIGLRTSLLEEQERTLEMLTNFVDALGEQYEPYVDSTAKALGPLLGYVLSETVKQKALSCMAFLLQASRAAQRGTAQVQQLLAATASQVLQTLEDGDVAADDLSAEASGLVTCLDKAGGGVLQTEHVGNMSDRVFSAIDKSAVRRDALTARYAADECDEEDMDTLQMEHEEEHTLRVALLEVLGKLMVHHPNETVNSSCAGRSVRFIADNLASNVLEDRAAALYLLCDVLEYLQERLWSSVHVFMQPLCDACTHDSPIVRRAAAYGIAQAAKLSRFSPFVAHAQAQLMAAFRRPDASSTKDHKCSTDNVVVALGEIAQLYSPPLLSEEACRASLETWLGYLPLKADTDEAKKTHRTLIKFMTENNSKVLGPDNCHLPRLIAVISQIYRTELSDAATDTNIRRLLSHLGADAVTGLSASFVDPQRQKLARAFKDAREEQQRQQQQQTIASSDNL